MSTRRVSVCGASFVCSVDSTKWPVCAALMAISAVSRSRISPTMMTSGSWRRNARMAAAKVSPTFGLTLTWLTPGRLISAGSSAVEMLVSSRLRMLRPVYSDTVLPLPVGPVTRIMPWGLARILRVELFLERLVAQRVDAQHRLRGIENTHHDLLAEQRGAGAHAEVDGAVLRQLHLDAAVLRDAPLGDVESRHDLQARRQLLGELHRAAARSPSARRPCAVGRDRSSRTARNGCPRRRGGWHPA